MTSTRAGGGSESLLENAQATRRNWHLPEEVMAD
jgi:hypothetical protein